MCRGVVAMLSCGPFGQLHTALESGGGAFQCLARSPRLDWLAVGLRSVQRAISAASIRMIDSAFVYTCTWTTSSLQRLGCLREVFVSVSPPPYKMLIVVRRSYSLVLADVSM